MGLQELYPQAKDFYFQGGSTAVLLIHGFTASPSQMRKLGHALHDAGYTVRGMLLPGHGTDMEDMLAHNWQDWLRAVRSEVIEMMSRSKKVVVLGLSLGGVLTLLMAQELPVDGIVCLAAATRLQDKLTPFAGLLSLVSPFRIKKRTEIDPQDVSYDRHPLRKVTDLCTLARMARLNLDKITCPMLIMQGKLDQMVTAQAPAEIMANTVNCHDKELVWLEHSPHVCSNGPDFEPLTESVLRFLKKIDALDAVD